MQFKALGTSFLLPLLISPAVAAVLGTLVYGLLKLLRCLPAKRHPVLDTLHYLSAGGASFARGLNDTPKMVALLMVLPDFDIRWGFVIVATAIALGGLLDADKVAETLGKKVTGLDPGQGFAASLVTAALVITASLKSTPLSTTHISVGSLLGIGAVTGQAHWQKIVEIMIVWVTTVPCGAFLAAIAYAVITALV